ncbi:MAG: RagB/SusD family nutrient uptake outer membrane protein [Paludibacteraceae bacterium]|nr:RagB/SusD family nutrient uptake outer membrane protein [Paludibacteraceae bacterium]
MKASKIILGVLVAVSVTSCNFLQSESPSAMDAQTVYSSPELTEQAITGVYHLFGGDKGFRNRLSCGYMGMNSDVEYGNKKHHTQVYDVQVSGTDVTSANGSDPWGYLSTGIERCNNIIEGLNEYADLGDETMRYYLGEALFLRSFQYLTMVNLWGDVPARFVSMSKDPESANARKENRNVIYAQIRNDLKTAKDLIPWSGECPTMAKDKAFRPSKGAVIALLMRIDMYYAGKGVRPDSYQSGPVDNVDTELQRELYAEVIDLFSELYSKEDSKWIPEYVDIFKTISRDEESYSKTEVMWQIPFPEGRGQYLQYNCPSVKDALLGLKNNQNGSTNSNMIIVPTLYYDYADNDKRRDVTIVPYSWIYDDGESFNSDKDEEKIANAFPDKPDGKFLYQKLQSAKMLYGGKCRVEWMSRERTGNDDGVDFPVIRYTDCMLMAAEASLGGIQGAVPSNAGDVDAIALVNRVRTRAGIGNVASVDMNTIMIERKFELTGEYVRKFDLMRWGVVKDSLVRAHERITQMNLHEGDYATLPDTIYYKYRKLTDAEAVEYRYDAEVAAVYVVDEIYGLKPGETGKPATYDSDPTWIKKNFYASKSARYLNVEFDVPSSNSYILYPNSKPENLNSRQYWPIFSTNLNGENLWNDYGY